MQAPQPTVDRRVRERITAYVVIGVLVAAVLLVRGAMAHGDEEAFQAASQDIGWTDAQTSDHIARDLFERINDERTARLLPPLVWHDGLAELARGWSEHMIANEYRHSDDAYRRHRDFIATGENIAMGYRGASDVHVGWMESDGHREAILYGGFTAVGIGVVCRNDGRLWGTQVFGMPHHTPIVRDPIGGDGPHPIMRRDDGPSCPRSGRR